MSAQYSPSHTELQCGSCRLSFTSQPGQYLDLVLPVNAAQAQQQQQQQQQQTPRQRPWLGTELFRSSIVSAVYERGWRQGFRLAGFPGPAKEAAMALQHMQHARGGLLIDASCASGLFTRLFAASGHFAAVIALDYSEAMLRQAQAYLAADKAVAASSAALLSVRADIGRLPFPSGSVDAVHAGAALHCWPDPAAGLAEVCRVLKPGGVLVATTALTPAVLFRAALGEAAAAAAAKVFAYHTSGKNGFTLFEEPRLAQLVAGAGLGGYSSTTRGMFVMITATKPVTASSLR